MPKLSESIVSLTWASQMNQFGYIFHTATFAPDDNLFIITITPDNRNTEVHMYANGNTRRRIVDSTDWLDAKPVALALLKEELEKLDL